MGSIKDTLELLAWSLVSVFRVVSPSQGQEIQVAGQDQGKERQVLLTSLFMTIPLAFISKWQGALYKQTDTSNKGAWLSCKLRK